jgi:hypothetical protein
LKIALGHKIQSGPWGGGNRFAAALAETLREQGSRVVDHLDDPDIDLVLIVDPRAHNPAVPFTPGQVFRYLTAHPQTLVVHRINECDERKGTRTMNARLRLANLVADHTVFIGSWLKELDIWRHESPSSVILNGADARLFNAKGHQPWSGQEPFRLVTHHWGGNALKGFDVYDRIDALLEEGAWRNRLVFTYVGNLPPGKRFRHAHHIPALNGEDLADELKRHHGYVTASVNEPAGMHHIEGALCGLPLLYRNSGSLPEYCAGFGQMFEGLHDVEAALERLIAKYSVHCRALADYPHTAEKMSATYLSLFDQLLSGRGELAGRRHLWRDPLAGLLIQPPW